MAIGKELLKEALRQKNPTCGHTSFKVILQTALKDIPGDSLVVNLPPGPLVARFRDLGGLEDGQLVAGPWGDLSPDLHKLLLVFAESRVAAMSRAQGWEAGPGQLGKVMGEIRRALSVTVVRANALCLMERLSQLGPGAGAAAKRRQGAMQLEERRRQERQAFDLAWLARGSTRVGRAFV